MKILPSALVLILIVVFLGSCGSSPFCRAGTKNTGDIVEVYSDCLTPLVITNGEFVVRSLKDLDSGTCLKNMASFDFQNYSIIGKEVTGGCNVRIISRDVKIDQSAKQYRYTITFKDCGLCKRMAIVPNRVIVPKIPNDYEVSFDVVEK